MTDYRMALEPLANAQRHRRAWEELNAAEACGLFFLSCADCFAFHAGVERSALVAELIALIDRERTTCARAVTLLEVDERIGWHDEVQGRMAEPVTVRRKLDDMTDLREQVMALSGV